MLGSNAIVIGLAGRSMPPLHPSGLRVDQFRRWDAPQHDGRSTASKGRAVLQLSLKQGPAGDIDRPRRHTYGFLEEVRRWRHGRAPFDLRNQAMHQLQFISLKAEK